MSRQLDATLPPAPRPVFGVVPPRLYAGRARKVIFRASLVFRRSWWLVFLGFLEPLFYLLVLGGGLNGIVGPVTDPFGRTVSYLAYIAPGLLAASVMNGAVYESTMSVFFKLRHAKLYRAMLAAPVGAGDVALGEITWAAVRGGGYALGFLTVMAALGLVEPGPALLALPAALLVAFAFGAVGFAATTFMRSWEDSQLVQLVTVPLLLFSTTFFPLSVYPGPVRVVVECSPLYQAIQLLRGLTTTAPAGSVLPSVGYFLVLAAVGLAVATVRLHRTATS